MSPALKGTLAKAPKDLVSSISTPSRLSVGSTLTPRFNPALRGGVNFGLSRLVSVQVQNSPGGAQLLAAASVQRIQSLIRMNPRELDADDVGQAILRGQLLLFDPDLKTLARLAAVGFPVLKDEEVLGSRVVTVSVPVALSTAAGMQKLRAVAPHAAADFNHIYEPAGGSLAPSATRAARSAGAGGTIIGMIDGGVADHPAVNGRVIEQRGFAGMPAPTAHGTAVASLLVGKDGRFKGAASSARLLVADIYGGRETAGSATSIAQALAWLASKQPKVINISLVGPRNELVRRAVAAIVARRIPLVAAVGNDGPAAPPRYPASYPGVVSVTGVDAHGAVLFEAGNAAHLDFAAPGADMAAARPGRGYAQVRGTSFAAPLAAGRLALVNSPQLLAAEARPGKGRVGRGIVCLPCRVAPDAVGAK